MNQCESFEKKEEDTSQHEIEKKILSTIAA